MSTVLGKIYKMTNKVNGKIYIGCTINSIEERLNEHFYRCFIINYNSKLYNSIKKYGKDNFDIELIEECEKDNLYKKEMEYIKKYNSFKEGLNSTLGGEGCLGYRHSDEIRKKISENTRNGNSHRGKTYEILYGRNATEEKLKRKNSVKISWQNMNSEQKNARKQKSRESLQNKSKYSVELVKEIKEKIQQGYKVSELRILYPQVYKNFFYDLKNGNRWSNI